MGSQLRELLERRRALRSRLRKNTSFCDPSHCPKSTIKAESSPSLGLSPVARRFFMSALPLTKPENISNLLTMDQEYAAPAIVADNVLEKNWNAERDRS